MQKLFLTFAFLFFTLSACASHTHYIRNNPDLLKPGLRASAFLEAWGNPVEMLSFKDYQARRDFYSYVTGSSNSISGFVSGYGLEATYTPNRVVWIYKKQKKALFFQKEYLMYDLFHAIPVWRLKGWENLKD
jgi:hypothetical protein